MVCGSKFVRHITADETSDGEQDQISLAQTQAGEEVKYTHFIFLHLERYFKGH